jgi:RecB family endonuclease NucS
MIRIRRSRTVKSVLSGPVRNGQYGVTPMRLLVARCEVRYSRRLTAVLPEAVRLLIFKSDGSVLVHDDSGGFKPLNCIRRVFRPEGGFRRWAS